jgi:chromosomal replication initiation ATPase DnaA
MYCPHCKRFIDTVPLRDKVSDAVNLACEMFGVPPSEVMSGARQRNVVHVRHVVMAVLYHQNQMTLAAIGRAMDRDHTSVLHAIRSADKDHVKKVAEALAKL